jgi:hypothetical protein
VRFSTTVCVVFRGGGILSLLPPPFSSSPSLVFNFFLMLFFCSILLRQKCCCSGLLASFPSWPFAAHCSSSSMKQPGYTLVLRWILLKIRSTYLRSTRAYTHHSTVTTGLSALHRHLAIHRLHCTRWDVSSTRLRVDLMRRRVSPTLRAIAPSCNFLPWTIHSSDCSSTLFTITAGLVFYCISACIFVYVLPCNFLLFFDGFIFLLFCLGFSLHLVLCLFFELETSVPLWFFAVPVLHLPLYSGGCFTRIGLFTKFLCNLHHLVQPCNKLDLLIVLFELLVITIACCLVLWTGSRSCSFFCTTFYHLGLLLESPPQYRFVSRMFHFFFLLDKKWE